MIGALPGAPAYVYYAAGTLVALGAAFAAGFYFAVSKEIQHEIEAIGGEDTADGFKMNIKPSGGGGLISSYMRDKKKRGALSDGSVRWHLVGSSFEKPRYVRPEREQGGNIPQIEHEGEIYHFPEDAAIYSEEEGVPTFIHRRGESDPIELRDQWEHAIDAKTLSSYLTLVVTSDDPNKGALSALGDYTAMQLFRYGLLAIVGLFVVIQLVS